MTARELGEDRFVPARTPDEAGRGDHRREAILRVLDESLRTRRLDEISVGALASGAGVSRSAFYFYFDSKAGAVAVLLADLEQEAYGSADHLVDPTADPAATVREVLDRLTDRALEHAHVYRAMVEAKALHPGVREMWDARRADMASGIAAYVTARRATGEIVPGPDADQLAEMLVEVNEAAIERVVLGSSGGTDVDRDRILGTAAFLWVQTLYGRSGRPGPPDRPEEAHR